MYMYDDSPSRHYIADYSAMSSLANDPFFHAGPAPSKRPRPHGKDAAPVKRKRPQQVHCTTSIPRLVMLLMVLKDVDVKAGRSDARGPRGKRDKTAAPVRKAAMDIDDEEASSGDDLADEKYDIHD